MSTPLVQCPLIWKTVTLMNLIPARFMQDAAFAKVLTLNLQRVFTLTQKCLPLLRAAATAGGVSGQVYKDPARIINVGPMTPLAFNFLSVRYRLDQLMVYEFQTSRPMHTRHPRQVFTILVGFLPPDWVLKALQVIPLPAVGSLPSFLSCFHSTFDHLVLL